MKATTVGALRQAGYDVVPDDPPHALISLPQPPDKADYDAIAASFGDSTIPNPSYKGTK